MPAGPLLILTALRAEADAILNALGPARRPLTPSIEVRTVGPRAVALGSIHVPPGLGLIIIAGLGGGLDPTLRTGDVVIDDPRPGSALPPQGCRGRIQTVDAIVTSPGEKAALYARTHAACVDMEQGIVRAWAAPCGVPVVGIRSICDTAHECLDAALLNLVDSSGSPRIAAAAFLVIHRPLLFATMLRMARQSREGLKSLGASVSRFVDQEPT